MKTPIHRSRALAWLVLAAGAAPALAQQYQAVPLGSLGGSFARPLGVNDVGIVVGSATNVNEDTRAFVWESGVMRELPGLAEGFSAEANGINASGVIVGHAFNASGQDRAVTWTRQPDNTWAINDLGTLGGSFARASAIAANGRITGASQIAPPPPPARFQTSHAFSYENGVMTDLGVLRFSDPNAAVFSEGTAINASGQVVGFAYPVLSAELDHAFAYDNGVMIDLTPRGFRPMMRATGINDAGVIVGFVADREITGGPTRAYRLTLADPRPEFIALLPGHAENQANAVNNDGAIVGTSYGSGPDAEQRAFLATSQGVFDLNALAGNPTPALTDATAISPTGLIAAAAATPFGSSAVLLRPVVGCVADVDNGTFTGTPDGGVTIDDLLYYIFLFEQGAVAADIDDGTGTGTRDGGVTIDDLLYFLLRFERGC